MAFRHYRSSSQKKEDDYEEYTVRNKKSFLSRTLVETDTFYEHIYKNPCKIGNWNANSTCPFIKKIQTDSNEYKRIVAAIARSGDIKRIRIDTIHEINNPFLSTLYDIKKLELQRVYKNMQELTLYHGTDNGNCNSICIENFDYRLCGTSRGVKYGQGVSFSPYFFYAKCFCNKMAHKIKTVFLCDVLYGRSHIGDECTVIPSKGYDTTTRDKKEVYVKYDDDTFIPRYKITFILKY